jgi:hypothetical protein
LKTSQNVNYKSLLFNIKGLVIFSKKSIDG